MAFAGLGLILLISVTGLLMVFVASVAFMIWHGYFYWYDNYREDPQAAAERNLAGAPVLHHFDAFPWMSAPNTQSADDGWSSPGMRNLPPTPPRQPGFGAIARSTVEELEEEEPAPSDGRDVRPATVADIACGYATQFGHKFGGTTAFHQANVDAVRAQYDMDMNDICYCFLCLENVVGASEGRDLNLKRYGVGPYAARVWVTVLARFVKAALGDRSALDEELIRPLCAEWKYKEDAFLKELKACEALFQRKYGAELLQAFDQPLLRRHELVRACSLLGALCATFAPRTLTAIADGASGTSSTFPSSPRPALGDDPNRRWGLAAREPFRPVDPDSLANKRSLDSEAQDCQEGPRKRARQSAIEDDQQRTLRKRAMPKCTKLT